MDWLRRQVDEKTLAPRKHAPSDAMRHDRGAALPPDSSLMTRRPKTLRGPVDHTPDHARWILAAATTASKPGKFVLALPVPDGCPTVCACILLRQRACTHTDTPH